MKVTRNELKKIIKDCLIEEHASDFNKDERTRFEEIPVEFAYNIRNKDATRLTDLPDGSLVDTEELYEDIKKNGLHDPILIRLNKNTRTVKVESGNHRVISYYDNEEKTIPAVLLVVDEINDKGPNGDHAYNIKNIDWDMLEVGMCKPSTYLKF
jgi:hypothetical protein